MRTEAVGLLTMREGGFAFEPPALVTPATTSGKYVLSNPSALAADTASAGTQSAKSLVQSF